MDVKYIIDILSHFPDNTPVNVHIEYGQGKILRAPGVTINYVNGDGTILDVPGDDVKEISFFVVDSLVGLRRKINKGDNS